MEDAGIRVFWLLFAGALVSLLVLWVLQVVALVMLFRRPRRAKRGDELPPISILKPLKGADPELCNNLEALIRQDYPVFEIIFGVADAEDPVIPVIRRLMRLHPEAPLRLCIGASETGMNPKVNNLVHMARHARYEALLISDADVRPGPDYLRAIASELEPGVGLVHNVLLGVGERRLGAVLESLHMNSFVAATLCGAHALRHSCVVGKSMLFAKRDLTAIGGLGAVENVLAEDYVLGQRFQRSGYRVRLSTYALPVVNPERDLASFFNRQLRWAQMRRRVCLRAYVAEVLGNPVAWLAAWLPWALLVPVGVGSPSLWAGAAMAVAVAKCAGDVVLSRALRGDFGALRHVSWIPVKDLLIALVWLLGFVKRRILWRGNVMWIGAESRLYANRNDRGPVVDVVRA